MTDRVMMENILLILKSNLEVYTHGTIESCNPDVRDALNYGLNETLKLQKEVFNEMSENGWYNLNNIESKEINKTLKKIGN